MPSSFRHSFVFYGTLNIFVGQQTDTDNAGVLNNIIIETRKGQLLQFDRGAVEIQRCSPNTVDGLGRHEWKEMKDTFIFSFDARVNVDGMLMGTLY